MELVAKTSFLWEKLSRYFSVFEKNVAMRDMGGLLQVLTTAHDVRLM